MITSGRLWVITKVETARTDQLLSSWHTAVVISGPLPNLDSLDIEAWKALVMAQHESSHQQIQDPELVIEK